MLMKKLIPLCGQITRFGIVGILATITHFYSLTVLVDKLSFHPLLANPMAFILGFIVSFSGHFYWTFAKSQQISTAIRRFFIVALINLGLNQCLYSLFFTVFMLDYRYAQLIALVSVPPIVYLLSRYWAFR